jgi:regulatory protein
LPPEPDAAQAALRALSAADRSRAELEQRLDAKGFTEEEREEALDELERLGYLDDGRTARERARRLAERGYGNAYIRADLEQRGLPVEEALAELEPESERLERYAGKGSAWLARRGFAHDGRAAIG